ncbi:hypothetical protein [Devosia sp. SL43]|uniref:hypothetical protein n=1 Tax=Devosia sp. SL43 TaxID=2806348 RepID=UPI001F470855|nr:hypothetical protein [Devosia sp. SL43]UJW87395.1 hypothetical protein IM737_09250 [Devosia sp. SL43]
MSIVFNLLLFTHLVALVVGASTNVVMPLLMSRMAAAGAQLGPVLGSVAQTMSRNSQRALMVLVLTGLAMVAIVVAEGRVTSPSPWFIAKIAIVLCLLGLLLTRGLPVFARVKPATFGVVTRVFLLSIIFCSVMAFNPT